MRVTTVSVRCPCCGQKSVDAIMRHDDTPGSRPGWEMDDYTAECECYDYLQRVPKVVRSGVYVDAAYEQYMADIEERALEAIR